MTNKDFSDLSLSRIECPKCSAIWLNGKHVWHTGAQSPNSEMDLAGLVCNKYGDHTCVNPCKGQEGGDTWADRLAFISAASSELNCDS